MLSGIRNKVLGQKKTLPISEQILLLNRLANLLKNGYTFHKAIQLLKHDPKQGHLVSYIEKELLKGKNLDKIFQSLGYANTVVSFLYFSQTTGNLEQSLLNSSNLLNQQKAYEDKLKKVLQYPSLLFIILIFLLLGLKIFLLPLLSTMFQNFPSSGEEDIPSVMWLFHTLEIFINSFFIFLILCIFSWYLWKRLKPTIPLHIKLKIYHYFPIIRSYKRIITTYLFSYHFSSLLENGLSIKDTLQIMANQNHLPFVQHYSNSLIKAISAGKFLPNTIKSFSLMEKELPIIFQRSLNDGSLEKDLYHYANILIETLTTRISKILSVIQPIIYLIFGGIIITIYISILFPIFQLIQQI
jgi:competence protein ComGB